MRGPLNEAPVFYDPSGRRRKWSKRVLLGLILVILAAALGFGATILNVPAPDPLKLGIERAQPRPLNVQVARLRRAVSRRVTSWLPGTSRAPMPDRRQLVVGFYVPWDDSSRASLARHIGEIDWLVPAIAYVTGPQHQLRYTPNAPLKAVLAASQHRPALLPMVQNAIDGEFDGAGAAALLHSSTARAALLDGVTRMLEQENAAGVTFDFEELPDDVQPYYRRLIAEAHARFAPRKWLVTLAVPVDDPDWNLKAYAKSADKLFLMDYDEHYPGGEAGPVASQPWFVQRLRAALTQVGPDKAIVAIGNYAYDWADGKTNAESLTVESAWLTAYDNEAVTRFDPVSGNATFDYHNDDDGLLHHVWMLDAASGWNELRAVKAAGAAGVALWRLGGEDPGMWSNFAAIRRGDTPPAYGPLRSIGNVIVTGSGEIIHIDHTPKDGSRTVTGDARGLIRDEHYAAYPTPYVVNRTGYSKKLIALTFDDGPDATWTPQILDILEAKHAPATFFVIGENALAHPLILKRILDGGSEIGNHSYTHPNLALVSPRGARIELNATQRLVEAYTGRAMRLFRAPYFGDAEPTTTDELGPALQAQNAGYVNIGLHVDPDDWKRPGTPAIIQNVFDDIAAGDELDEGAFNKSRNVILLHDSGGDRAQTVAALPAIIDGLRARGFTIVPVSQLAGLARRTVNPPISGSDLIAVRFDVAMFLMLAGLDDLLKYLFFIAIFLGTARAILLAVLAVRSNLKRNRPVPPAIDPARFVSVLIPAYNEARVIEASVRRVLDSEQVGIEVIVIDDGSQDETSAIVRAAFSSDARVRLLSLENGGKARALNEGLKLASGEVIVALDADTQFEPLTIARLSRWFADPEIGAVAGNAKVGNRINLVTRWQAVEYVTAQNLERRALSRFDAITVVPGAVGAWRRAALDQVGGYPHDTLAEDQDLTIAIQRKGWLVEYDIDAVAWTEAPETFGALARQRFRWAFGTLQCLWKHRRILRDRHPAGLALVGIPQAWAFQIGFALISPLIDLALLVSIIATVLRVEQHGWAQTQSDVLHMGAYWIGFTAIDAICGWIAYRLEPREKHYPVILLLCQRFIYRQIMYSVVVRAVAAAVRGPWVGWGKLERSGRVTATS